MGNSKHKFHQPDMEAREVLRLYAEGFRLVCRYCKVEFVTTPEILAPGERPTVVSCPNNINHMHLIAEPVAAMQGVRNALNARNKSNK